jgi:hypothetical protein
MRRGPAGDFTGRNTNSTHVPVGRYALSCEAGLRLNIGQHNHEASTTPLTAVREAAGRRVHALGRNRNDAPQSRLATRFVMCFEQLKSQAATVKTM